MAKSSPFPSAEKSSSVILRKRSENRLTAAEFQRLADVPPEAEWFANITNPQTRRAYRHDLKSFMRFVGIACPEEFRTVTRAHILAWRESLRPTDENERTRRTQRGESRRLTFVTVDAPESEHFTVMPSTLNLVTNPKLAYLRLHGRNAEGYIKGKTVADRFNHDYTKPELQQIEKRVDKIVEEEKPEEIHIAANNNRSGYAPRTAEWLTAALIADAERRARQQNLELPLA